MFTHRERERAPNDRWQRPKVVSDFLRRAIENTVGSVEKSGSLSREALQYLLQQGDKGKKEVTRNANTRSPRISNTTSTARRG